MLLLTIFIYLCPLDLFLLFLNLVLHHPLLYVMLILFLIGILMLFGYKFALFSFLFLVQHNCVFYFFGLCIPLLFHHLDVLSVLFLSLLLCHFNDHFLLHTFLVLSFESLYIVSSLLCLLDFLPGFHFFLFQQGYTICEQLGISLNTISNEGIG